MEDQKTKGKKYTFIGWMLGVARGGREGRGRSHEGEREGEGGSGGGRRKKETVYKEGERDGEEGREAAEGRGRGR